jgi:subtilisin family serine protease
MKLRACLILLSALLLANCPVFGLSAPGQNISTIGSSFSDTDIRAEFNRLTNNVRRDGNVQIMVVLKEGVYTGGLLNSQRIPNEQLKLIENEQNMLLSEVPIRQVRSIKRFSHLPFLAMSVDESELQRLRTSPYVSQIFEDHIYFPINHEFSIAQIGADAGWALGYAGAGQTIAILDSGVDKNNPLLQNKVVAEACFSTRNPRLKVTPQCRKGRTAHRGLASATVSCGFLDYECAHGTLMAGLAAGNSLAVNFAGSGVAPQATILAVKVDSLIRNSRVCFPAQRCHGVFESDLLRGLDLVYRWRRFLNTPSINISIGFNATRRQCVTTLIRRAVAKLRAVNIATIAASGNDGFSNKLSSPACVSGVISVGATNSFDQISDFSNNAAALSLLAPGEFIGLRLPGVDPPGLIALFSGTSLSASLVSGAWAALKSHKPSATVDEILSSLVNTGIPVYDARNGLVKSRIQVNQAHAALGP